MLIHKALIDCHMKYPDDTLPPILQFEDAFYGHFDIEGEIIDIPTPKYMTDRVSTKGRVIKGTANTKYKNNFYFG